MMYVLYKDWSSNSTNDPLAVRRASLTVDRSNVVGEEGIEFFLDRGGKRGTFMFRLSEKDAAELADLIKEHLE